jgi:hypothetical protein
MNKRNCISILWIIFIAVLLTHCDKGNSDLKLTMSSNKHNAVSEILPNEKTGYIEGTTCYPADGIPSDMRIYAENMGNKKIYMERISSIDDVNIYVDAVKYKMRLPEGSYYVYAMTSREGPYKAYYSDFVTCGYHVKCMSHKPILINIRANVTMKNVNPCDWYDSTNKSSNK